ncbi:hypothetical protein EMIHUDRAFT_424451 [Emiliania huxleyi CCMP1516]|uniref:Ankyrin repeat protein n=2 Tax=Emiliania huxleyi TaxID=2903 RepID=A0A0D3JLJ6_EMIH1|nr:hypothetical protein EMIHUDRAFT_424451 [Emiliania huxleyi CCMP1516]EOD24381.1 hypothetical protein EMIHUDRAFT_424451 [Emiliania huxleyi CCMP1516]|eukprot:XP_005776810.1 hypothetical protein EMIHUDRAFT_424451 [Emiliania huxleyi CCMP1516]
MGNKKPEKKDAAEKAAELAAKAQKYLVKAIQDDSVKAIESALKKGADLLSADEYGNTPLHVAAMYGSCHAIGYLHAHGADLSARNFAGCNLVPPKEGRTPLESAQKVGEPRAIEMLTALAEGRPFDVDAAEDSDDELPGEEEAAASPAAAATGQEQDSPDATASQPPQAAMEALSVVAPGAA